MQGTSGSAKGDSLGERYIEAYETVYGQNPSMRYVGNHWYLVNGETVHGSMLQREIEHLTELARIQREQHKRRSAIQRLIGRLRGM
jgi:hypothetical protein